MTALALTALLLLCLHETGRCLHRLLPAPMPITAAETMALGMGAWIGLGGFLNSIDAARPPVLGALAAFALCAGFVRLLRGARRRPPAGREIAACWPLAPLLLSVVVIAVFAMPTAALNVHDDLRNYLVLPYRMLATGTLAGSALDSIGVDALGAQSFMQGLVLMLIPAGFAPLFDSVACLLLAGLLLDAMGRRLACPAPLRLVVLLLFVMLDAQAINLSAAYSAAVLTLALLLLALRVAAGEAESRKSARGSGFRAGLLAAALCSLKMPHALFAVLLLVGVVVLFALLRVARRGVLLYAAVAATGVLLTPWLIVFWRTHGESVAAWLAGRGAPLASGDGSALGLLASSSSYFTSPSQDYVWLLSCVAVLGQRPLHGFVAQTRAVVDETRLFGVAMSDEDRRGMQRALGVQAYDLIRWFQAQVPAGAVVLAPTGLALHFDFARNPVITLHGTVLAAPWTPVPVDVDEARLARLLAKLRVDYLLLQDAGIGVRPVAELRTMRDTAGVSAVMKRLAARELAWRVALDAVAAQGREVYASPPLRLIALPR